MHCTIVGNPFFLRVFESVQIQYCQVDTWDWCFSANIDSFVFTMHKTFVINWVTYVQNILQPSFVGSFDVVGPIGIFLHSCLKTYLFHESYHRSFTSSSRTFFLIFHFCACARLGWPSRQLQNACTYIVGLSGICSAPKSKLTRTHQEMR